MVYDPATEEGAFLDLWAEAGVTEAGTGVSSWVDGLGSVDFVQGADANRPTHEAAGLGGKPSVLGVAANADSLLVATLANAAKDWTLIVACQPISNVPSMYLLDSQTGRLIFAQCTLTANKVGYWDGAFRDSGEGTTDAQILTWELDDGVGGDVLRGESSIGAGTYTGVAMGGGCGLFANFGGAGQFADIRVGRLMLFSTIDAARDARVRAWMGSHYGI